MSKFNGEWMSGFYRVCTLHNIPAVVLPRLQPEKFLVAFVRAECLRVILQFLFLAQDAWGGENMRLHRKSFLLFADVHLHGRLN